MRVMGAWAAVCCAWIVGCTATPIAGTPATADATASAAGLDGAAGQGVRPTDAAPLTTAASGAAASEAETGTHVPPALRPVPGPADAMARARASAGRGLACIIANQRPDGSFGTFESPRAREIFLDTQASHRAFHTATSALVCWALIAPARTDPAAAAALDRGLAWLEAQGEVGRASGNTFYSVWSHTYLVELAITGLPYVEETRSISRYALSQVTVVFEKGTDIYFARNLINERLQQAKSEMPGGH